jgi:psiF repeat
MRVSRWLVAAGALLMVVAGQGAFAQASTATTPHELNSQQQKMKECAAEGKAKGVKGEEHKAFMSSCLSSKGMSQEDINKQQQKMKTCNADAKTKALKGADYKAFMKSCLSGSG